MAFDPRRYPNAFRVRTLIEKAMSMEVHCGKCGRFRDLTFSRPSHQRALIEGRKQLAPPNSPERWSNLRKRARVRSRPQPTRPPDPPRRVDRPRLNQFPGAASRNAPHKPFFHDFRGYRSAAISSCVRHVSRAAPVQMVTVAAYGLALAASQSNSQATRLQARADLKDSDPKQCEPA